MIIRRKFPPVYKNVHPKTGATYFQVCVRRDGQNYRKTFSTEEPALDHARQLAEQFQRYGIQPEVPHEDKLRADAYQKLVERLTPFGKTPEEGIARCLETLADEAISQAKPTVGKLVDQFQAHKLLEKVDEQYRNEIKVHCKFIKRTWGDRRIDDLRKNEVETTLTKSHTNKNTRRKYLTFVRMFFNWVQGEDKGYVLTNPTTGIRFKADSFEKEFYPPETLKTLLRLALTDHKPLVGYYALLTFAGLRPSEGARVQWQHINFATNELHVIKGKTDARHVLLEPVAIEWLKWHRENSPKDAPFVPQQNLFNLERELRVAFRALNAGKWISDGLRHGFATFFRALKKSDQETSWYMGNSVQMVKKHYAKSIPQSELDSFWQMTPAVVLADKAAKK